MTSVLAEISQWAAKRLKYWEQAALDKIVSGVAFTETDYEELLQYLLEDAGLSESKAARPTPRFPDSDSGAQAAAPVRLVGISNLQNINALVPGQTLTFGPQMTAIFGANGSGKSGYARVLGCAGFTRGDREVLPDVTCPIDDSATLSADVEVEAGDTRRVPSTHHSDPSTRHSDLSTRHSDLSTRHSEWNEESRSRLNGGARDI